MSPAPINSIQPDHLHILHPIPSQNGQEKSTSTPGSTKGKYQGRIRIVTSFPKISESIVVIVNFRCQIPIFLSTTIPSTW